MTLVIQLYKKYIEWMNFSSKLIVVISVNNTKNPCSATTVHNVHNRVISRFFEIEVNMQSSMHLLEISIFSLNNVTVRFTKIMNNLLKHLKILIFKVIFQCWKLFESFQKKIFEEYWTRRATFIKKSFLLHFQVLYFLEMCPIFVSSVHNFGTTDGDII